MQSYWRMTREVGFGEVAMMMQIPRTSDVISTKPCILFGSWDAAFSDRKRA